MRIETIPTYDRIKRLSEPITIVFSNGAVIRLRRPTPDEWNRYREKALRILAKGRYKKHLKQYKKLKAETFDSLIIGVENAVYESAGLKEPIGLHNLHRFPFELKFLCFHDTFEDPTKASWTFDSLAKISH